MKISALLLLLALTAVRPVPDDSYTLKITYDPEWQVTVYKEARIPSGSWEITNGMPSPQYPCAWVVTINLNDQYRLTPVPGFGGGQCIEPLVQCVSDNCP